MLKNEEKNARRRFTKEIVCKNCGKTFIFRCTKDKEPALCSYCYNKIKKDREQRELELRQKQLDEKWKRQHELDCERFEQELKNTAVISMDDLSCVGKTLYVIGNGFDLMHGVKSSYRSFCNSMGKHNSFRETLEIYLEAEDIWADFENALGHIRFDLMTDPYVIEDMLEYTGYFDDDAGAAEFYLAQEMAITPMIEISTDLEKYLRRWVDRLEVGTKDRPLKSLIHDDKVLCFNYTEFIESLYGVSPQNICYIHGCRKKIKGKPRERLIMGHQTNATKEVFEKIDYIESVNSFETQSIALAQENAIDLLEKYDDDLTKDCQTIIAEHKDFFSNLSEIENIIVIGHSLSQVDWEYFFELEKNIKNAQWYFGCHGIRDYNNMKELSSELGIDPIVFRTDHVSVQLLSEETECSKSNCKNRAIKPITLQSKDQLWKVEWMDRKLNITNSSNSLCRIMQSTIKRCFFSPQENFLLVIMQGYSIGIALFKLIGGVWQYVEELKPVSNQEIVNRRLRRVYINSENLTFVYNNRVIEYALDSAYLIRNIKKRDAKSEKYDGTDITGLFF